MSLRSLQNSSLNHLKDVPQERVPVPGYQRPGTIYVYVMMPGAVTGMSDMTIILPNVASFITVSPVDLEPAANISHNVSVLPAITGVPAESPDQLAPSSVTAPTMLAGSAISGRTSISSPIRSASSGSHFFSSGLNSSVPCAST